MKKKLLYLILALSIPLAGCTSSASDTYTTETLDDGTYIMHSKSGDTYYYENLPQNIIYEDTSFELEKVLFYEEPANEYAYDLWAVVFFDMSSMSEEEYYWYDDADPMDFIYFSVSSEQNKLDAETLYIEDHTYFTQDKKDVIVFRLSNYRYSMADATFDFSFSLEQGGTYTYTNDEGKSSDLPKSDDHGYFNIPIPSELGTLDDLNSEYPGLYQNLFNN